MSIQRPSVLDRAASARWLAAVCLICLLAIGCSGDSPSAPDAPVPSPTEHHEATSSLYSEAGAPVPIDTSSGPFGQDAERILTLEARPSVVPPGGGEVELVAKVTSDGEPESGVTIVFVTSAGRILPSREGVTGAAGRVTGTLTTSKAAIVVAEVQVAGITILASNEVAVAVGQVVRDRSVELLSEVVGGAAEAGETETLRVRARRGETPVPGRLSVALGDGESRAFDSFTGEVSIRHTWEKARVYQIRLTLMEGDGSVHERTEPLAVDEPAARGLKMKARARRTPAREAFAVQVRPALRGKPAPGDIVIDWGDGRSSRLLDIDKPTWVEHTYRDKGSYRVVASLVDGRGKRSRARMRVRVQDRIRIKGSLITHDPAPLVGTPVRFVFRVERSDGERAAGTARIDFGDGTTSDAEVSGQSSFTHTYRRTGRFKAVAELTDDDGRIARGRQSVVVRAASTGGGGGGGSGGGGSGGGGGDGGSGGGGGSDALSPGQVNWLHANPSGWSVSSRITNVRIGGGQICIDHTKAGSWPVVSAIEGNPWIIAKVNGRWHGATYEWLRPGQTCKFITAGNIGPHTKASPLATWRPRSGEVVYFMVSTPGRAGVTTINQRSNIVRVVWP